MMATHKVCVSYKQEYDCTFRFKGTFCKQNNEICIQMIFEQILLDLFVINAARVNYKHIFPFLSFRLDSIHCFRACSMNTKGTEIYITIAFVCNDFAQIQSVPSSMQTTVLILHQLIYMVLIHLTDMEQLLSLSLSKYHILLIV